MIVVDSSALVAILRGEPEADGFLRAVASASGCLVSSVSLLETSMVLAGRAGGEERWLELDELIARARMTIVAQDAELARAARAARAAFLRFGKGRHKAALNMAECASYAVARVHNLPLLIKGEGFPCTDLVSAAIPA